MSFAPLPQLVQGAAAVPVQGLTARRGGLSSLTLLSAPRVVSGGPWSRWWKVLLGGPGEGVYISPFQGLLS